MTARCPCCGRHLVVRVDGTFPRHEIRRNAGVRSGYCPGSYWLVEDEERVA